MPKTQNFFVIVVTLNTNFEWKLKKVNKNQKIRKQNPQIKLISIFSHIIDVTLKKKVKPLPKINFPTILFFNQLESHTDSSEFIFESCETSRCRHKK